MRIERSRGFPAPGAPGLFWLGQAGFWIETGAHRVLIDPYLSDSLAKKYAGRKNGHRRMMPPPMAVEALPRPDVVLVSHAHTDHMDPETLGPLAERFPDLCFVVPAACEDTARERIGSRAKLLQADAGDVLEAVPGLTLSVFPAAHETAETDGQGRHVFLGYGMASNGLRIYHSGDCVPFPGLAEAVERFRPEIALLPVNGRDEARRAEGVPGNFTLAEAVSLAANIPFLIPHHFGMFAFNTIDPEAIDTAAERHAGWPVIIRPVAGETLSIV